MVILSLPLFYVNLNNNTFMMTEILIDKKKYVLIPEKNYQELIKKAALKTKPEKHFLLKKPVHTAKK